jgi:hypothetical protein
MSKRRNLKCEKKRKKWNKTTDGSQMLARDDIWLKTSGWGIFQQFVSVFLVHSSLHNCHWASDFAVVVDQMKSRTLFMIISAVCPNANKVLSISNSWPLKISDEPSSY